MFNIASLRDLDVRQQDLFENQRRGTKGEFGAVFLTVKDPKAWTRFDGEESSKEGAEISDGFRELKPWEAFVGFQTDEDGWTYMKDFNDPNPDYQPGADKLVRRRYWGRLIVRASEFDTAQAALAQDEKKRYLRYGYNLEFVRMTMRGFPYCVSIIYENERINKAARSAEIPFFCKESMRTTDPHLWTDASYADITSVQSVLAADESRVPAVDLNPRLSARDVSMSGVIYYCANVDSVTVPDGWAVVRGFNFMVDESTDVDGWQYNSNFVDDASTPAPPNQQMNSVASNGSSNTSSSHRTGSSGGRLNSAGGKSSWSNRFDTKNHNVRRRQWCRMMVPAQHLQAALDVCDRYLVRNPRGHVFSSSSLYFEVGKCCGRAYKQLKAMLFDDNIVLFNGNRREGVFALTPMTRVSQTDTRNKEYVRHPFLFRLDDTSDPFAPRFLNVATSDPLARIRWMDIIRNHVGLIDKSGRDVIGGPPDDPSVPIYSSSLSSYTTVPSARPSNFSSRESGASMRESGGSSRASMGNPINRKASNASSSASAGNKSALREPLIDVDNGTGSSGHVANPISATAGANGTTSGATGAKNASYMAPSYAPPAANNASATSTSAAPGKIALTAVTSSASAANNPSPHSHTNTTNAAATKSPVAAITNTSAPSATTTSPSAGTPVVDPDVLRVGSLCRKRLMGDHVYHLRFIWVANTDKGMAFFWSKTEATKNDNKFVYIRNFTSIELLPHRKRLFRGARGMNAGDGGAMFASDKESVISSGVESGFESNCIQIKCKAGVRAGGKDVSGIEFKLENNDIARIWIDTITHYMSTQV